MQLSLHGTYSPVVSSSTCEVKAWSLCYDSWKETTRGETGMCPRNAVLPVRQNRSRRSEPAFQRTPDRMMKAGAMCTGWHMVLGIMQRHTAGLKPGTVHSTTGSGLSYWQSPHQLLYFYLQCKISWTGFFPSQHPVDFSCSCKHWHVSCPVLPGLLPTYTALGRSVLLTMSIHISWQVKVTTCYWLKKD